MEAKPIKMKKDLSAPALLALARRKFERIQDSATRSVNIALPDCLMSGLALFGLKYPSLLQFDDDARGDEVVKHNLKTLYNVEQVPSDTYLRERLDEVDPRSLQKPINSVMERVQRGKVLEHYQFLEGYYLVALDASGYFSSKEIHCNSCCEKKHQDGTITYHHQMLAAVMVHPAYKPVFPLALEPIEKQDGTTKNDCEHNAAKRLLTQLRTSHPHLKIILICDALYADGPMLNFFKELNMRFIVTAKETDLKKLFEFYRGVKPEEVVRMGQGEEQRYHFLNGLPLNDTHSDFEVNLLEQFEKRGCEEQYFARITDLPLTQRTVESIATGGRARWKIENETFNTLKNQGYQFEHNFGHGYKNLSTVFAYLMFLAFFIDQVQEFCCNHFKAALKAAGRRSRFWRRLRGLVFHYFVDSWEQLYSAIAGGIRRTRLADALDTS